MISATGEQVAAEHIPQLVHGHGFTLVELLVVLAIMVLLSASLPLAINRMLPARRVAVTADRLIDDIRWLQHRASSSGEPHQLTLSESGYRLHVEEQDVKTVELSRSTAIDLHSFGSNLTVDELTVYPDGTTSAGRFEISDSGRQAAVEISMLTGRARRTR